MSTDRDWTDEDLKRRRRKSIAIALILAGMVVLFYVITLVRLGGNVADRAI